MQAQVNLIMLVCAAFAAMAFGVMLGYACCKGLFAILRIQSQPEESEPVEAAVISSTLS